MYNRSMWKITSGLALSFLMMFSASLKAQDTWESIPVVAHGEPIPTLKAIGVKAIAECDGRTYPAYVIAHGRVGGGIIFIDMVIEGLGDAIPGAELDEFRGPDLSQKAIDKDAIRICLKQSKGTKVFSTRLEVGTGWVPDNVLGASKEYFTTNPRAGKQELKKSAELLNTLSQGISEGRLVIGEGIFSKKIVVKFGGEGVEPLAKELKRFILKK